MSGNGKTVSNSLIVDIDNSASYVTFDNTQNVEVGRLFLDDGILKFEGNADESAQIFLNALGRQLGVPLELLKKIGVE